MRAPASARIDTADALRGVAALSVAWYHFTHGNTHFLSAGVLKDSGLYGWLGVEVFFVISGFVLPYSLFRAGYSLRHFLVFVAKRVVRLDPPYLASIAVLLALNYIASKAPGFHGAPSQVSLVQLALHLGYLNAFFGRPWLNPVFWTLALEFQFYLLIGVIYSAVASRNARCRVGAFGLLAVLALSFPNSSLVFHWLLLFSLGILTFQYRAGLIRMRTYLLGLGITSFGCAITLGLLITSVGLGAALLIAFVQIRSRVLLFLGGISYSLYLLHVPVGGKVVNLGLRFAHSEASKGLILVVAVALSLVVACLFNRVVEAPAQRASARIRYGAARRLPVPDAMPALGFSAQPEPSMVVE